ncbi:MAG: hypothetical protein FWH04_04265, partial [Oscillospiraceae bacterium]|nr:hypothetical protein [Oscillospiraceae bacterium]
NNFARLLRKGLTLHLSDKPYDSRQKQLEAGAVEVKFPKIDPAIPLPKLAVNYLFGENEPSHYGEFNGQWLMATKVKKGQTPVVDKSVQIGLAVMFPNAKNPAKPPKPGKTVDENGWGEFYPGETNGICVKELEKNTKGKDMTVKTTYFYRTAPRLNDDGTTFTAASKPKKIRALSQLKRPKYKIGQNKAKADTTYVNGTPYAKKAQFTLTSGDVVWHGATVKKPASATQLAN